MFVNNNAGQDTVWWVGADNNVYHREGDKVNNYGAFQGGNSYGYESATRSGQGVRINDPNSPQSNQASYNTGDGSSGSRAAAQSQIDQINRLLGVLGAQESGGIDKINQGYNQANTRLTEDQQRANLGYKQQGDQNTKAKVQGLGQVDEFANTSYNNLQRVLQGAGAGNSSVGRQLIPQLISKGAGKRRGGVIDTAGENAQAIDWAKKDADTQFGRSFADLQGQRASQENQFRQGITQQRMDLEAQRRGFESNAGLATGATDAALNERAAQLQALFGNVAPNYNTQAVNLQRPELSQFAVDPATIRLGNQGPAETRYFNPLLKKREELKRA